MGEREVLQSMRRRHWLLQGRKSVLGWGLVVVMLALASGAIGQPTMTQLLQTLNLSDYPPGLWPPPFKGPTAAGQAVSLADFKGRVVLVNFWATWCAECRPEMPMFERLHHDFAAQGLTVLGVNYREEAPIVRRYAETVGLTFALVLDPQGEITRSYGVIGVPTTFLVGRDGRPVALAVGPRSWESQEARDLIRALLAESVAEKDRQ